MACFFRAITLWKLWFMAFVKVQIPTSLLVRDSDTQYVNPLRNSTPEKIEYFVSSLALT